jgi:putative transposase
VGVFGGLLEEGVGALVGPRGKWNPERLAVGHGGEDGEVTLGGRRVPVERPRVRTVGGESEVPFESCEHFGDRDRLETVVLERMLAGVSTRQHLRAREPVGEQVEAGQGRSRRRRACSCGAPAISCGG